METKLKTDSEKATSIQDRRVHLEEELAKLRQSTREMRNTLEKYTSNLQVNKDVEL